MTMGDVELFERALKDATDRMWMAVGTLGGTANPPVDAPRMIVSGDKMADVMEQVDTATRRHERMKVLAELANASAEELIATAMEV